MCKAKRGNVSRQIMRLKAKADLVSAFLKGEGFMERIRKLMSLLLILALCFTFIPTVNVQAASKVKINKTKATVYVGKTTTLKVSGTKKAVKWTTSNKKVATVSSKGKVTAKKAGSAKIGRASCRERV